MGPSRLGGTVSPSRHGITFFADSTHGPTVLTWNSYSLEKVSGGLAVSFGRRPKRIRTCRSPLQRPATATALWIGPLRRPWASRRRAGEDLLVARAVFLSAKMTFPYGPIALSAPRVKIRVHTYTCK
jgi:hypothetical protein